MYAMLPATASRDVFLRRQPRYIGRMNIDPLPLDDAAWGPDASGRFGEFGGRFVPETLMAAVLQLEEAYAAARSDPAFWQEYHHWLTHYVGRPSPLHFAARLTQQL